MPSYDEQEKEKTKLSISLGQLMFIPMLLSVIIVLFFQYTSFLNERFDNLQRQIDKIEIELKELRKSNRQ